MKQFISIIIPNYNGGRTIGRCLEAIAALGDDASEVIVIDDASSDNSRDIIRRYPCRLVQLDSHAGASAARNAGARSSRGDVLFFIDSDCLLQEDTLARVRKNIKDQSPDTVIGGTYTVTPPDTDFFSRFQSAFINYSETKKSSRPDYVATHAMVIRTETFTRIGGLTEKFLPILEDVEFSHRLRRAGYKLLIDRDLQVRHIFDFSLLKSLRNAARKTRYWIVYSLANNDMLSDSGTASSELKIAGGVWIVTLLLVLLALVTEQRGLLMPLPFLWLVDVFAGRNLFKAFYTAGGTLFAALAAMYYMMIYPAAVWWGALRGLAGCTFQRAINMRCRDTGKQSQSRGL